MLSCLDVKLLGEGEEAVELLLHHVHLALVHEVEDGLQVRVLDPPQVEERVLVRIAPQDVPKTGRLIATIPYRRYRTVPTGANQNT